MSLAKTRSDSRQPKLESPMKRHGRDPVTAVSLEFGVPSPWNARAQMSVLLARYRAGSWASALWAATAITLRGGRSGDVVRRLGAVWPDTPSSAPRCATCICPRVAQPDHPAARAAAAAGRERGELAPLRRKTRIIPTRKVRPHRDSNSGYRRERAVSWASRRWGRRARPFSITTARCARFRAAPLRKRWRAPSSADPGRRWTSAHPACRRGTRTARLRCR